MKSKLLTMLLAFICMNVYCTAVNAHNYFVGTEKRKVGVYEYKFFSKNPTKHWVIPAKYNDIRKLDQYPDAFLVQPEKGSKFNWGIMTAKNKVLVPFNYTYEELDLLLSGDYRRGAQKFIERKINEWQVRGEYEKIDAYKKRVNNDTRSALISKLSREVEEASLKLLQARDFNLEIQSYDPDHESFLIDSPYDELIVPVPIDFAPEFKENFDKYKREVSVGMFNWTPYVKTVIFKNKGKECAHYNRSTPTTYANVELKLDFDDIEVPYQGFETPSNQQIINTSVQVGIADVDKNIPSGKSKNKETFAVIIANENYKYESKVNYAVNDGNMVHEYLKKTLGIPEENIRLVTDATKNEIINQLDWIKNVSGVYDGKLNLIIYYAGHGIPDEATGQQYLVPVDANGRNIKTCYSIKDFYASLAEIPTSKTVVLLDACFSGSQRNGNTLVAARGIALKSKQEKPQGNLIVLSAAQGDETAWPYEDMQHGLFTYYLLKKLQSSKGNVTIHDLFEFISQEVKQKSVLYQNKIQTPSIQVSPDLDNWMQLKLD